WRPQLGAVRFVAGAGATRSGSASAELVGSGAPSAAVGTAAVASAAGGTTASGGGSLATGVSAWDCGPLGDAWTSGASAAWFAAFFVRAALLGCLGTSAWRIEIRRKRSGKIRSNVVRRRQAERSQDIEGD